MNESCRARAQGCTSKGKANYGKVYSSLAFLHGFLGNPDDWNEVVRFLPDYRCFKLVYPFQIPSDAILIGYSMGGRIALRYSNPKIVISAHPGLRTRQEKVARWKIDQAWITLLNSVDFPTFLKKWYSQPLFDTLRAHPSFPQILSRRLQQDSRNLGEILRKESLAHQPFFTSQNTVFLHGDLDIKYKNLYQRLDLPSLEVARAGHAAHLENPAKCAKVIKTGLTSLQNNRPLA